MKKDKDTVKNKILIDSYDYLANSASVNDCTGLIPSAPQSKEELQAYKDLYNYTPPEINKKLH